MDLMTELWGALQPRFAENPGWASGGVRAPIVRTPRLRTRRRCRRAHSTARPCTSAALTPWSVGASMPPRSLSEEHRRRLVGEARARGVVCAACQPRLKWCQLAQFTRVHKVVRLQEARGSSGDLPGGHLLFGSFLENSAATGGSGASSSCRVGVPGASIGCRTVTIRGRAHNVQYTDGDRGVVFISIHAEPIATSK